MALKKLRAVSCWQVVGVVEVLAGLDHDAFGLVVEVLVAAAGDDPPWPQRPDPVDGVAPGVAASVRRLGEVLVGAVVQSPRPAALRRRSSRLPYIGPN